MADIKQELVKALNANLMLEMSARIQYLVHAEVVSGIFVEPVMGRLKEIAGDEGKHEEKFRTMIGDYLGGVPTMEIAKGQVARNVDEILAVNIQAEKHAIDEYKKTYRMIIDNKDQLPYVFDSLEHDLRHIIMEEQEHITELERIKSA
jgi:bacterioferritin (cytochrome b1)